MTTTGRNMVVQTANILEYVSLYCGHGFLPIPVPYGRKGPVLVDWQKLRITAVNAAEHFNGRPSNVGFRVGELSGNYCDVDLDVPEAASVAPLLLPETPMRHGHASKPNSHWGYRVPVLPPSERFNDVRAGPEGGEALLLEFFTGMRETSDGVMAESARQIIVPPSTHEGTGEPVRWESGCDPEPSLVEAPILVDAVRKVAAATILARHWPQPGSRQRCALALAGWLLRCGLPVIVVETIVEAAAHGAADDQVAHRVECVADTNRKLGSGDDATGRPKLAELLTGDGRAVVERVEAWLGLTRSIGAETGQAADRQSGGHADNVLLPSGFKSIGELLSLPEEKQAWQVDGLLPAAGSSLVVAKPKVGKSISVQNLGLAVARGEPYLGRATKPGVVLYCALEEKCSEVVRHLRAMGACEEDQLFVWTGAAPQDAMDWLNRASAEKVPVLIIIDTLQRFLRFPDLNDYATVINGMEPLLTLARTTGAHLLMTHHGNKRGGQDGDGVLGSVGLFGSVDTLIEMRRSGDRRTIRSQQRYGTDLEESVVEMELATYRIHLAGTRQESDEREAADEILAFLETRSEPVDEPTVMENVEGRTGIKRSALRQLREAGKIHREGKGHRGSPYRYSRFLVPGTYSERENESPQSIDFSHQGAEFSRSPELAGQTMWQQTREQQSGRASEPVAVQASDTGHRCMCDSVSAMVTAGSGWCPACYPGSQAI